MPSLMWNTEDEKGQEARILPLEWRSVQRLELCRVLLLLEARVQVHRRLSSGSTLPEEEG